MKKRIFAIALAGIMASMLMTGFAMAGEESTSITVTDMTGREITLEEPAERIVALSAADCEGCSSHRPRLGTVCNIAMLSFYHSPFWQSQHLVRRYDTPYHRPPQKSTVFSLFSEISTLSTTSVCGHLSTSPEWR